MNTARPLPDADATRDTLRALLPHVRRWLVRLLGRSPDLDDATQDALTEIARFLPRFEGRSKLETAAHKITVRVAYRYFRTRKEVALEAVPEPIDPETAADERLLAREALARLQRALRRLPAKRRMAFALCAIEGKTPTEAAELAGTTAVAMRCRLVWARREVARLLDKDPYLAPYLERAAQHADAQEDEP
ncbi:MAG: RNA polymerase sigma factor [Deltaproteobacteria bacterium]|nr:RNA polymerase sigma factor [Deltaproteobacteria bacterium]